MGVVISVLTEVEAIFSLLVSHLCSPCPFYGSEDTRSTFKSTSWMLSCTRAQICERGNWRNGKYVQLAKWSLWWTRETMIYENDTNPTRAQMETHVSRGWLMLVERSVREILTEIKCRVNFSLLHKMFVKSTAFPNAFLVSWTFLT